MQDTSVEVHESLEIIEANAKAKGTPATGVLEEETRSKNGQTCWSGLKLNP